MIDLLNYFELISIAYWHGVADQRIIEEGFRGALLRWHEVIEPFIAVTREAHRASYVNHEPWEPFVRLIHHWKAPAEGMRQMTA